MAKVAVFAIVEEFYGGCGSEDNCSGAVIRGEAMMAVVRCSDGSCDHFSGGDDCISAMKLIHYHYYTTNCHNCHHCPFHCHHGLNKRHQYNWHNYKNHHKPVPPLQPQQILPPMPPFSQHPPISSPKALSLLVYSHHPLTKESALIPLPQLASCRKYMLVILALMPVMAVCGGKVVSLHVFML